MQSITWYDSLGAPGVDDRQIADVAKMLLKWVKATQHVLQLDDGWRTGWKLARGECPRQADNHSCGVAVCHLAAVLGSGNMTSTDTHMKNAIQIRARLSAALLTFYDADSQGGLKDAGGVWVNSVACNAMKYQQWRPRIWLVWHSVALCISSTLCQQPGRYEAQPHTLFQKSEGEGTGGQYWER